MEESTPWEDLAGLPVPLHRRLDASCHVAASCPARRRDGNIRNDQPAHFRKVLGQFIQNSVRNESFESAEQGLMGADCALVPRKPMVNA